MLRHNLPLPRRHLRHLPTRRKSLLPTPTQMPLLLIVIRMWLALARREPTHIRRALLLHTWVHRWLETVLGALVLHHGRTRRTSIPSRSAAMTLLHMRRHVGLSVWWHGRERLLLWRWAVDIAT